MGVMELKLQWKKWDDIFLGRDICQLSQYKFDEEYEVKIEDDAIVSEMLSNNSINNRNEIFAVIDG
eukprot:8687316-Ditylum_brightwellii.AAC.1